MERQEEISDILGIPKPDKIVFTSTEKDILISAIKIAMKSRCSVAENIICQDLVKRFENMICQESQVGDFKIWKK